MTAHSTQISGLKFGIPGRIERDDEICLEIRSSETYIIQVSHSNRLIALLVERHDHFVDMVDPSGHWIIPVGLSHPTTRQFSSPFELNTLFALASHANLCNS